jgi:hypothetical protein
MASDPRQARQERQPVDARQLLERFSGLDLGQIQLGEMQLSQRGQYEEGSGFYVCLHRLPLLP